MPDHLPDVLHSAGLTPHEVGWLQLHAEPVLRGSDGKAVAELWLQAAFHPPGSGRVVMEDAATGDVVAEALLPAVSGGAVVRWRIPLSLGPGVAAVRYHVDGAEVPEDAVRIRAPWRLLDTIELRLPEEDQVSGLDISAQLAEGAAAVAMTAGLIGPEAGMLARRLRSTARRSGVRPSGMKVHPARQRLRDLASDVLTAGPYEKFDPIIETLWMPGDAVDSEALKKRLHEHRPAGPLCPACGAVLVPGGEFCPRCLGPVAAAAARSDEVPVSSLGPLTTMAPELAARAAQERQQVEEQEVARCGIHPERTSTGTCNRCGAFFCDECASETSPGLCARCAHKQASPEVVVPQVYRDAALVHLALFASLVLRPFVGVLFEYRYTFGVVDALPFAGLGILLFGFHRVAMLLIAVAVDLLVLIDGYWVDDWSRLLFAGMALALTVMLWLRLPEASAPRFPETPA